MPVTDQDIAARLQAAGVGTVGTDIFEGAIRAPSTVIPHAALFVTPTGGVAPLPFLDNGTTSYYRPSVQIIIRGNVGAYRTTRATAASALAAVHLSTVSGYFQVLARNSEPLYLGLDDTEHPIFSVNVELFYTG